MSEGVSQDWESIEGKVGRHVLEQSQKCLGAYRENPTLVLEHANIERATAQGGYGRRQLFELVQNGADALIGTTGAIHVILTESALYCANEGDPIDAEGVTAILQSYVSMKRGQQIGRFGLGFKSVLGVTDQPEFYSRSGSFTFDSAFSEKAIRAVAPDALRFPTLRIAMPEDPADAGRNDPVLRELMDWATTVVKLPLGSGRGVWLSDNLAEFPGQFLLFVPHVEVLTLEDRTGGITKIRDIRIVRVGEELELTEPGSRARWKVFTTRHTPSNEARADAGELADREDIPIAWAVPTSGPLREGAFWAFFPTESRTTLSGILNAPWKTNEDRQNLLQGAFNVELLDASARMIAGAIPSLSTPDDPCRYLDLLPARGRESRNWADRHLGDVVYEVASAAPCLPDQRGLLRTPGELDMAPELVSDRALSRWEGLPDRPVAWVHHSALNRERTPRAIRLLNHDGERIRSSIIAWLEALVVDPTERASAGAIAVAEAISEDADERQSEELRRARIVLTDSERLVDFSLGSAYLSGEYRPHRAISYVHDKLASDAETRRRLQRLGVTPVTPETELEGMLARGAHSVADWGREEWERFWEVVRRTEVDRAAGIVQTAVGGKTPSTIRAKTVSGQFRPLHRTLLSGPVVPQDGSRDATVAIDVSFHVGEVEALERLGAVPSPIEWTHAEEEPWYQEFHENAIREYMSALPSEGSRPDESYLVFESSLTPGPLSVLEELSEDGAVRFSSALLDSLTGNERWTIAHRTIRTYPRRDFEAPALWMLKRLGRLSTSLGPREVGQAVGPSLANWERIVPVATCSHAHAERLGLPKSLETLSVEHWDAALHETVRLDDDLQIGGFYTEASRFIGPPERVRCRVGQAHGSLPPGQVTVTSDLHEFRTLVENGTPVVRVATSGDRSRLEADWGMLPSERSVQRRIHLVPSTPEVRLVDEYQGLEWCTQDNVEGWRLQRCSELYVETLTETGRGHYAQTFIIEEKVVFVSDKLTDDELLSHLGNDGPFTITPEDIDDILDQRQNTKRNQLQSNIRNQTTDGDKLVTAVGPQALRQHLPNGLMNAVEEIHGNLDDGKLGEVALAMYGYESLRLLKRELEEADLLPPGQWAGSPAAQRFTRDLGFPAEYAGTRGASREPLVEVDGPTELPKLHKFQREIAAEVRSLLARQENRRALIALPTGAGKTRVAVQAIVEAVRHDAFSGRVLWVADRDELCEQAVQSWSEIWHSLGSDSRLHISRLWGTNDATPLDGELHVVVATIQKLRGIVDDPAYAWLSRPACVVVDEAHSSIGPEYTALLSWTGLGRSQARDLTTLLGLTATPFRGVSQEETQRLVSRYGRRRLDIEALGDFPERALQDMGVLSHVDHELIPGEEVQLSEDELIQLRQLRQLPRDTELLLGQSVPRNIRLLESMKKLPRDWPIIFFATSVAHAQTMAALLTLEGIPAAAVSADTSATTRRQYVERFRNGDIQVLTNYGVLTQGFDAPSTRAVYIARPTYSPNLYQQMIGRGLRGPKNGGEERCLVVNVEDNVAQYGEALAFHEFDHLWRSQ